MPRHPLALAIVAAARERRLARSEVAGFDSPTGKGVPGTVGGRQLALGNAHFLGELSFDTAALEGEAEWLRRDGATAVFLAVDGAAAAIFAIADPVKQTTPEALQAPAAEKARVVMLTGDNRTPPSHGHRHRRRLLMPPVIAAAAMALSSVSVVGNAFRLRRLEL